MAKQKTIARKKAETTGLTLEEAAALSREEREKIQNVKPLSPEKLKEAEEADTLAEEAAAPKKSTQEDVDALLAQGINPVGKQGRELLSAQERTGENATDAVRQAIMEQQQAEAAQPRATALTGFDRALEISPGISGIIPLGAGFGTIAASLAGKTPGEVLTAAAKSISARGAIKGAISLAAGSTAGLITVGVITGSQFITRAKLSALGNAITELDAQTAKLSALPPEEAFALSAQMEFELNRIERSVKAVGKHDSIYFVQQGVKQGAQIETSRVNIAVARRNALLRIGQQAAAQSRGVLP